MAQNGQLNQQLREIEVARIATIQRVEEMQRANIIALRQAEMIHGRLNTERPRAQGILEGTRAEGDELADAISFTTVSDSSFASSTSLIIRDIVSTCSSIFFRNASRSTSTSSTRCLRLSLLSPLLTIPASLLYLPCSVEKSF